MPAQLVVLPPRYAQSESAQEQQELARAQAAWATRQATLDSRIPRYSQRVTADQLDAALRVLHGLFAHVPNDPCPVTLRGAIRWAALLLEMADDAEAAGHAPTVPLPYVWHSARELDAYEAADTLVEREDVLPPRVRRRRKPKST